MSMLERLKQLEAKGNLRDPSRKFACQQVSPTEMDEVFEALPKLLAVVDAHKALLDYCDSRFTWSAKPEEWEYLSDEVALKDAFNALAALEEDL